MKALNFEIYVEFMHTFLKSNPPEKFDSKVSQQMSVKPLVINGAAIPVHSHMRIPRTA